jgi:hypothetical protein
MQSPPVWILREKVEVATAMDAGQGTGGLREPGDAFGHQRRIVLEIEVGVRRGDNVGGAGVGRQTDHGEALLEGAGAVVKLPEDVAVNVDQRRRKGEHAGGMPTSPPG